MKGRNIKTFHSDDTGQPGHIPSGLHIFAPQREITERLIWDELDDAKNLFWNPKHRANSKIHMIRSTPGPTCNLLFYPGCQKADFTMQDVLDILFVEAPALAQYTLMSSGISCCWLESMTLALNHYDPMGAINQHVDTVYVFNGTLGPIFTVAMGPSEKIAGPGSCASP